MRLLLDRHALIWWLEDSPKLSQPARSAIEAETNDVHVSASTAWEIATKHRIGKLPSAAALARDMPAALRREGFRPLSVTVEHGQRAGMLPGPHRDPFDRVLVAQALVENLAPVSNEEAFDRFGVQRLW